MFLSLTHPMSSSHVSRSPMRERGSGDFDFDGVGKSPARQRNVSKSPLRERGTKTPMSVRTRDVTRSPMRGERTYTISGGVSKSPPRAVNGDIFKSPMRGVDNSGAEEEASGRKMTPTTPPNSWLPDDKHAGKSNDDYSGRRRAWRDQVDRVDQISEGRKSVYSDEHRMAREASVGNLVLGIDPSKENMQRDMRFRGDYVGKSRETADQWVTRRDGVGVIHGNSKVVVEHGRVSAPLSTAYGHSSYHHESVYGYGDPRHSSESLRGPASLQDLELERAELLRKYKELKDQLTNLDDKRFSSPGFYSGSHDYPEDESWRFRRGSGQQFVLDKSVRRPFHFNHGPGAVHHMEDEYNFAPLYDDPFSGQRTRASRPNRWHQDFDQEPLESYHDKTHYHHPRIGNDWQRQELPNSLACGTSSNIAANIGSSQSMNLERHGSQAYNPRMAQTSPRERPSHLAHHHHHHHPRRVLATNLKKQLCHPISGGAPFVLCNKCFRLLKLPQRFMALNKNQHQLQCGACSAVMSCDLQNRSSGLHSTQKKPDSVDAAASGLDEVLKESGVEHHRNSSGATSTNLGSYDFDAVGCSFQSMYSETSEVSKGQRSGISVADSKQHRSPSPSRSSKEDHISDNASVQSGTYLLPPPPGSPLRDPIAPYSYFGKPECGEATGYTEEVKQITEKDTSFESSTENTMDATEAEVHSNEVPTTSLSQDSGDDLREEDRAENKDRQSTIPALMKQGFVSRPGHGSHGRDEVYVYVNGQLIQHRLVKRAEKLAGPIQPGEYWYDSKAGFWGVMGHHCFGIIPSFIQEFSFPMPMNCSDGDTGVYINGRELHKRDLELLTSRGLPTTRNKSFIIDISGKVLDEETKEFVVNLGKLAPTVERNRCGFGMQVPEHLND